MSKVHKCPYCPKWFANKRWLERTHILTQHPRAFADAENTEGHKRTKQSSDHTPSQVLLKESDYWESLPDCFIRHHVNPRFQLYIPEDTSDTSDLPFDPLQLSDDRRTNVSYEYGATQQFMDNWRSGDANRTLQDAWTGTSVFFPRHVKRVRVNADLTRKNEQK